MTGISWTDETWNPVVGCKVVSPGCTNCYAMREAGGRLKSHYKYEGLTKTNKRGPVWTGGIRASVKVNELEAPARWRRPRQIFVCSMGDLFYERVGQAMIDHVFGMAMCCEHHVFQILTKRPERMRNEIVKLGEDLERLNLAAMSFIDYRKEYSGAWPPPNVWLGFSAEDQTRFDERVGPMVQLAYAGWKVFLSAEPLLGRIRIDRELVGRRRCGIQHVIAGGESGPRARPSHPAWFESLRDQCVVAGVDFHFKQWGVWAPGGEHLPWRGRAHVFPGGVVMHRLGTKKAGRRLNGRFYDARMT